VGAKHGANISTGIMTAFGEGKFLRILENVNRYCNYVLSFVIQNSEKAKCVMRSICRCLVLRMRKKRSVKIAKGSSENE
jgi:hypothetical protein